MTVTFYASLSHANLPRKLMRCVDIYPGLDNRDFCLDYLAVMDAEGFYCLSIVDVDFRTEVTFSNDKFDAILKCIDLNMAAMSRAEDHSFALMYESIPEFKRKIIKAINSHRTKSFAQNLRYTHTDILCGMNHMLEVSEVAMRFNSYVYWA